MKLLEKCLYIILFLLFSQSVFASEWYYLPPSVNVKKGDIILSRMENSPIKPIMDSLGFYWDHSMMVVDYNAGSTCWNQYNGVTSCSSLDYNNDNLLMRHNIWMPDQDEEKIKNNFHVRYGQAQSLKSSFYRKIGGLQTEEVLPSGEYSAILSVGNEADRSKITAVADELKKMYGFYDFFSYTDITLGKDFPFVYSNSFVHQDSIVDRFGGHCSGAIYYAYKKAHPHHSMNLFHFIGDEAIKNIAENLYFHIKNLVVDEVVDVRHIEEWPYEITTTLYINLWTLLFGLALDAGLLASDDIHINVASQIVNLLIFDKPGDTGQLWRCLGEPDCTGAVINSFAPDHFLQSAMQTRDDTGVIKHTGLQNGNNSYYNAIKDYRWSGGFYVNLFDQTCDPRPCQPNSCLNKTNPNHCLQSCN